MSRMFHVSSVFEDGYEGNPCFDAQFRLVEPRFDLNSSAVGENDVGNPSGFGESFGFQDGKVNPKFSVGENGVENPCGFGENFVFQDGKFNPKFPVGENGVENPCGYGEKGDVQDGKFDPAFSIGGNGLGIASGFGEKSDFQGGKFNPGFSVSGYDRGNSCGYGEKSVVQAWNAQYFQGESMVVVAEPNCGVGEWGEPGSVVDYKPLGLPVRSLRSRIRKGESGEVFSGIDESSYGSGDTSKSCDVESRSEQFGDLGARNLEETFDEAVVASPSPIPWRSKSGRRREMRESLGAVSRPSSHFRPLSVDEMQFESLRTQSWRSTASFSSHASSMSYSQGDDSPAHSVASEVMSSKMEDEVKATSFRGSSSASSGSTSPPKRMKPNERKAKSFQEGSSASSSSSPQKPMDDKVSTGAMHTRGYSFGSLHENDLRAAKDYLKEVRESRPEDLLDRKEPGPSTLNLEKKPKPAVHRKASLRGKSVRTIRASGLTTMEAKNCEEKQGNRIDEDVKTTFPRKEEVDGPVNGNSKQNFDTPPEYQKRETQELSEKVSTKCEEHVESEGKKIRLSSGEDTDAENVGSATPEYTSEVDKKAGEFIAKFREQIRLQKVASIERSRGLRLGGSFIR